MANVTTADNFTITSTIASTSTNSTSPPDLPYPEYVGYIGTIVAVVMYGSNFVPIKKFYTGDGIFFQWVLCCGIFMVGVVVQLVRQSTFYPLVMVGGAVWTTGNLCVVPIFKTIGMGIGMSTWSAFLLIVGWASGRFGLFDTKADMITNSYMNYAGVILAFGSILLYVVVKNEVSGSTDLKTQVNIDELNPPSPRPSSINDSRIIVDDRTNIIVFDRNNSLNEKSSNKAATESDDRMYIEDLSPIKKKIIGTSLAIFSGIMYGTQFVPTSYVQDHYGGSSNGLDFVFAQFCGIYVTSSVYFFIYCAIKTNKPKVYPEVILPGILSGIMWAIATTCWFIANAELSQAVSYPIIGTAPAAIASLFWGVIVFHEIKGLKNIIILLLAFCVMTTGAVLAGLSR
uniref:EamA domain-containing protein n=1 Tax=Arion vulgaris TaxID=1028688 RepID=A0A0B6ZYG4_9EUPU